MAVITNGTAVLGLGNIGALAGKPVMEGKGCLFKKFAGIDVFDIEIDETDPDKLVEIIAALEPTFGGINLEDIKAPECFMIETQAARAHEDPGLPRRPARHGDRGGRGPAQRAAGGRQGDRRGQAGLLGRRGRRHRLPRTSWSVWACGARTSGSPTARAWSTRAAPRPWTRRRRATRRTRRARTLAEIIEGADVFFGLSAGGRAQARDGGSGWPTRPIILAMANPDPEIRPELAKEVRPGLHHRHRPLGLSEPGQQRPVLPVHLPRRARRRRHHHQRGDEARLRARDRRAGAGRAVSDVVAAAYGRQDIRSARNT